MTTRSPRILVIKLSAFGDFFIALGLFEHLRAQHAGAHITLMTTRPYAELGAQSGYFDDVRTIARWKPWDLGEWLGYARSVRETPYDMVYDLQANDRTGILKLLSPSVMRRHWLDIKQGNVPPGMIDAKPLARRLPQDLSWLAHGATVTPPAAPYALIVAGSAPQHPAKRWPAASYAELAADLLAHGLTPVLLGTAAEAAATAQIKQAVPQAIDLTAQTQIADIAALALQAEVAIGNDTGPMHLISICGCPVVSLFSAASNPQQSAPQGTFVTVLQRDSLGDLPEVDVLAAALAARRA